MPFSRVCLARVAARRLTFAAFCALLPAAPSLCQSPEKAVEVACSQESRQEGASLWASTTTERKEGHVLVYRRLETVDGIVQKLLTVDGHAPDGPEKAKNDGILHSLLTDPAARSKMAETAHSDEARLKETLGILPTMYLFTDKSNDGTTRVLSFRPNPAYTPKSYEERALHSLTGEVRLNVPSTRIQALDATVSETVKFGFGLLGSLSKGGSIHIRFAKVGDNVWKTREVKLNIDGHIALVKSLSKTEDSERSDFERLPGNLSVLQALDRLQVRQ